MIRQLPPGFALVIRGGCSPVIARLPRAWNDPAYKRARRRGRAITTLTRALHPCPGWPGLPRPVAPGIDDELPPDPFPPGTTFPWT